MSDVQIHFFCLCVCFLFLSFEDKITTQIHPQNELKNSLSLTHAHKCMEKKKQLNKTYRIIYSTMVTFSPTHRGPKAVLMFSFSFACVIRGYLVIFIMTY